MWFLLSGVGLLFVLVGLFWLKDRLRSPLLARVAYSSLVARLALVGAALSVIGLLLALAQLADSWPPG